MRDEFRKQKAYEEKWNFKFFLDKSDLEWVEAENRSRRFTAHNLHLLNMIMGVEYMAIGDFAVPVWCKVGATVLHNGVSRTIASIEEVPSPERYWAERGQKELKITFEEGPHKYGWHGLTDPAAKPKRSSRK